jgi:hypothetical protein
MRATRPIFLSVFPLVVAMYVPLCTPTVRPTLAPRVAPLAEFWVRPTDLADRDLYAGPWSAEYAPDPDAEYTFVRPKKGGVNPGMVVRDPKGRTWHVKQAPDDGRPGEGPSEVVLSRVLSAAGYHQPPVYFLPSFTLRDGSVIRTVPGGRFRLNVKSLKARGDWSWQANPFVGMRPYQGLLVILLMFNSSDLKNSNNTLYDVDTGSGPAQWYVVRDLGAALGETGRLAPARNDVDVFARSRFITGVARDFVVFNYHGFHQELIHDRISSVDVSWACYLLSGLSEQQWQDAFRAGGYDRDVADRFIAALRSRLAQGRQIAGDDWPQP